MSRLIWGVALILAFGVGCKEKKSTTPKSESQTPPGDKTGPKTPQVKKKPIPLLQSPGFRKAQLKKHLVSIAAHVKPIKAGEKQDPKKLIASCIQKKGGLEKLKSVKTITAKMTLRGPINQDAENYVRYPGFLRSDVFVGGKLIRKVLIVGKSAWFVTGKKARKLSGALLERVLRSQMSDSVPFLTSANKPDAKLSYLGTAEIDGKKTFAVKLQVSESFAVTGFIDAVSSDLVGLRFFNGLDYMTVLESNFKPVGGLRFAHRSRLFLGKHVISATITSFVLNPTLKPDTFKVP